MKIGSRCRMAESILERKEEGNRETERRRIFVGS